MNVMRAGNLDLEIIGPDVADRGVCEAILRALPEWFGIEDSLLEYAAAVERLPTFMASITGKAVGFLSIKQHFPASSEIYVIAVHPAHHRAGVGRALVEAASTWLRRRGCEFLQVKTLGPSRPCEQYAKTRQFYESVGFRPLEEMKTLWNEANPCLVMVMSLRDG